MDDRRRTVRLEIGYDEFVAQFRMLFDQTGSRWREPREVRDRRCGGGSADRGRIERGTQPGEQHARVGEGQDLGPVRAAQPCVERDQQRAESGSGERADSEPERVVVEDRDPVAALDTEGCEPRRQGRRAGPQLAEARAIDALEATGVQFDRRGRLARGARRALDLGRLHEQRPHAGPVRGFAHREELARGPAARLGWAAAIVSTQPIVGSRSTCRNRARVAHRAEQGRRPVIGVEPVRG